MNAGIIFITKDQFLSGKKRNGEWSGIGGKVERGETPLRAAVREVLEEVYGVYDEELVDDLLQSSLEPVLVYSSADYVLYQLPLGALSAIARKVNSRGVRAGNFKMPVPPTIFGIVSNFLPRGELKQLKLFKFKDIESGMLRLDKYFLTDLNYIMQ
jgi:NUDIX domain